ncbi:MAG: twin-arginine translocation signal domain-containing protein [Chloroflexia bacterium]
MGGKVNTLDRRTFLKQSAVGAAAVAGGLYLGGARRATTRAQRGR